MPMDASVRLQEMSLGIEKQTPRLRGTLGEDTYCGK